jgi:hypothetical protein
MPKGRPRKPLSAAGAESVLSGRECRPLRPTQLLSVVICEHHSFLGDTIDVRFFSRVKQFALKTATATAISAVVIDLVFMSVSFGWKQEITELTEKLSVSSISPVQVFRCSELNSKCVHPLTSIYQ